MRRAAFITTEKWVYLSVSVSFTGGRIGETEHRRPVDRR